MKTIVITGSTRGIGYGLADSFLALGCELMVSGRTQESVDKAVEQLSVKHEADRIFGFPCNVREPDEIIALWDKTRSHFGKIDIWINNAGLGHPHMKTWELPLERVKDVVETNMLGMIHGSAIALQRMLEQGFGGIYFMEGMGSDGRKHDGLTIYGMTKYGMRYMIDSLAKETRDTPVLVGSIQPGMVLTEFVTGQFEGREEEWERFKPVFNIIGDRVETVTPWLAERILANQKHGARITWSTRSKLMLRFLTAPISKRNIFTEQE